MGRANLINMFDIYVAAFFLFSTWRRWRQYRAIFHILSRAPSRWPKLLTLLMENRGILLNRVTLAPTILAFLIMVVQIVFSRGILPEASVTLHDLREHWVVGVALLASGLPMLAIDAYFLIRVGTVNDEETIKQLDRAESWLAGWKVTLIRVITFGQVDPRQKVADEVRKALEELRQLISKSFYWLAAQYALRFSFGLTLWGSWALIR